MKYCTKKTTCALVKLKNNIFPTAPVKIRKLLFNFIKETYRRTTEMNVISKNIYRNSRHTLLCSYSKPLKCFCESEAAQKEMCLTSMSRRAEKMQLYKPPLLWKLSGQRTLISELKLGFVPFLESIERQRNFYFAGVMPVVKKSVK